MGSYATILGHEFKMTGLMVKAAKEIGFEEEIETGVYLFEREHVQNILSLMLRDLQAEKRLVSDDGRVAAATLRNLASEAEMAGMLVDWLVNAQEDQLLFA
jgi:hypothetical protein